MLPPLVSDYPRGYVETSFSVPGGTLKLGSAYRGYVETSFVRYFKTEKKQPFNYTPNNYTPNMIISDLISMGRYDSLSTSTH